MDAFELTGNNAGYYLKTAIQLCIASYDDFTKIVSAVVHDTDLKVVWGPAELRHWDGVSYSRAFIAEKAQSGECYVVIRGTNFDSLSSWLQQDFAISTSQPFGALPGRPPNVPTDALISQGTFNGMSDLIGLRDPITGATIVEFLSKHAPRYLYVTGHSLGGTLTPTMFAYLNAMLYGGGRIHNMALWSFAGLTAGGDGFNQYFNDLLPNAQSLQWRIHNSLDIAPQCWVSKLGLETIYAVQKIAPSLLERDAISDLFRDASDADIGYAHPQQGLQLPGQFRSAFPDDDSFALQALHQHHPATYQALIAARFP
jgi:Lipase (class 3)